MTILLMTTSPLGHRKKRFFLYISSWKRHWLWIFFIYCESWFRMYPIPSSIKSPQIAAFQSGVNSLSLKVFRNPSDISIWLEAFYAQALLINMYEYFSGQVCFNLHPACDAMFHLKRSSSASPFNMKIVEENVVFLEYTSPTSIVKSSN